MGETYKRIRPMFPLLSHMVSSSPPLPGVCLRGQPQKWGVSKCSVLSGGCQRGKTPRQKFFAKGVKQSGSSDKPLRAAASRQNGALRNITIFFPWLRKHTHCRPAEEGKARREAPGDGCIWLYVVGCMKNREGKKEPGREGEWGTGSLF